MVCPLQIQRDKYTVRKCPLDLVGLHSGLIEKNGHQLTLMITGWTAIQNHYLKETSLRARNHIEELTK